MVARTDGTTTSVTHPANTAGDLLILMVGVDAYNADLATPAGWTRLTPGALFNSAVSFSTFAKVGDGGTSTTLADPAEDLIWHCLRLLAAEWTGDLADIELTEDNDSGTRMGFAVHTPTKNCVTQPAIWIAGGVCDDNDGIGVPATPWDSNFLETLVTGGGPAGLDVVSSWIVDSALSHDPGTWTSGGGEETISVVISVKAAGPELAVHDGTGLRFATSEIHDGTTLRPVTSASFG